MHTCPALGVTLLLSRPRGSGAARPLRRMFAPLFGVGWFQVSRTARVRRQWAGWYPILVLRRLLKLHTSSVFRCADPPPHYLLLPSTA